MSSIRELLNGLRRTFTFWVVVAPWERAVRIRLGKHVTTLEPGVHLMLPFADRVYRQSIRLRTSDLGLQTVTTRDGKTVTISGNIRYRITDLERLYDTVHHPEDTLIDMAMGAVARFCSEREASECLPRELEEAVNQEVELTRFGLEGDGFRVTDLAVVRTYRLIQGDRRWHRGDNLDTTRHISQDDD